MSSKNHSERASDYIELDEDAVCRELDRIINGVADTNDCSTENHGDRCIDYRRSNFYLERVGFERKVNLRHNLKNGHNLIGRTGVVGVDIEVNSPYCSRKHCTITVSENSITITDLNTVNGTTKNGFRIREQHLQLYDTVGIGCEFHTVSNLVGNPNLFVYRLSKYSSSNLETIEIYDDDEVINVDDSFN